MRFRPRFSLRTFFIAFTIVCLWIGLGVRWRIERGNSIKHIEASGGMWKPASKVSWCTLFGNGAVERIIMTTLTLDERHQLQHVFPEARVLACADCNEAVLRTYGYYKTRYTYANGKYISRIANPGFPLPAE